MVVLYIVYRILYRRCGTDVAVQTLRYRRCSTDVAVQRLYGFRRYSIQTTPK